MSEQKPGFEIHGKFYAMPSSFRLGDPVLVTEVTAMAFPDFAEAIDDEDRRKDPTILTGLIAVSIWQANPTWRRDKVVRVVQQIGIEDIEVVGADDDEGDALPPASSSLGGDDS